MASRQRGCSRLCALELHRRACVLSCGLHEPFLASDAPRWHGCAALSSASAQPSAHHLHCTCPEAVLP